MDHATPRMIRWTIRLWYECLLYAHPTTTNPWLMYRSCEIHQFKSLSCLKTALGYSGAALMSAIKRDALADPRLDWDLRYLMELA